MARSSLARFHGPDRFARGRDEWGPGDLQPFGTNGVGTLTEHPVGLIVIAGVILIVIAGVPAARWFFCGALFLGGVIGFLLWLRDR